MPIKKYSVDSIETHSTECDSCEEREDDHYFYHHQAQTKIKQSKYKTEMCKKYSLMGFCNYGAKCKFAHGYHQLVQKPEVGNQHFRKKNCSKFWNMGECTYGMRCQFRHNQVSTETRTILKGLEAIGGNGPRRGERSRLLGLIEN